MPRLAAILTLAALAACQSAAVSSLAHQRGAWSHEKIDATEWPEVVKTQCRNRQVIPGMTKDQVVASIGRATSTGTLEGATVWSYRASDMSLWDGTYVPAITVRFNQAGIVTDVATSG